MEPELVDLTMTDSESEHNVTLVGQEDVKCPLCDVCITSYSLSFRERHVDACINESKKSELSIQSSESYVYKSRKSETATPVKHAARKQSSPRKTPTKKRTLNPPNIGGENSKSDRVKDSDIKPKREKRQVPDLKILKFEHGATKIGVDAFMYAPHAEIKHYFLSHFHSDHYMGLNKSWNNGIIYCSQITKSLCIMKLRANPELIVSLDFNEPYPIAGTEITVTMLDANHCPGSSIFLFEDSKEEKAWLHCGDFRVNKTILQHPLLQRQIDYVYLDTTYLNPVHSFPKQEHVIDTVAEFCERLTKNEYRKKMQVRITDLLRTPFSSHIPKKGYLIAIGTYTIGKERIAIEVAKRIGSKLYADVGKRRVLQTFGWKELDDLLTSDPFEASVHLVPMKYLNINRLDEYFASYRKRFEHIVAFRPTGWSFRSVPGQSFKWMKQVPRSEVLKQIVCKSANDFDLASIESQYNSDKIIQIYGVPYSEHSSFRELSFMAITMNIKSIVPTVNTHSPGSIQQMQTWIEEWREASSKKLVSSNDF